MRVIALRTIKQFVGSAPAYRDAREPALAWYQQVINADWASPSEIKRDTASASIMNNPAASSGVSNPKTTAKVYAPRGGELDPKRLKDGRVVFNIAGNKYRIVVWINYPYRVAYIRFIGTHRQYDQIDAQTI